MCNYKMMVLDFAAKAWLSRDMDENEKELLRLLYTRIGMVMEDASVIALSLGGSKSSFDPEKVAELEMGAEATSALTKAAIAIGK